MTEPKMNKPTLYQKARASKTFVTFFWTFGIVVLLTLFAVATTISNAESTFTGNTNHGGNNISNVGKFNEVLYVQAGNGTDIQTTIDRCPTTGCEVVLPCGDYSYSTTLVLPANIIFRGEGYCSNLIMNSTIGNDGDSDSYDNFMNISSNTTIEAILFTGFQNSTEWDTYPMNRTGDDILGAHVQNVIVRDTYHIGGGFNAIHFTNSDSNNILIDNVYIEDNEHPMTISGVNEVVINNPYIKSVNGFQRGIFLIGTNNVEINNPKIFGNSSVTINTIRIDDASSSRSVNTKIFGGTLQYGALEIESDDTLGVSQVKIIGTDFINFAAGQTPIKIVNDSTNVTDVTISNIYIENSSTSITVSDGNEGVSVSNVEINNVTNVVGGDDQQVDIWNVRDETNFIKQDILIFKDSAGMDFRGDASIPNSPEANVIKFRESFGAGVNFNITLDGADNALVFSSEGGKIFKLERDENTFIHISNITTADCDATNEGGVYYDGTTKKHYGCNSTHWNALY